MTQYSQIFVLILFALLLGCSSPSKDDPDKPNIIIIMVDDMGFSDIKPYGGEIDMPHLESLSDNGIKFTQFYNAGRCVPSRASLLTGQYAHKVGLGYMTAQDYGKPGYRGDLSMNSVTIAEVLRDVGYGTYMAGKWHLNQDFAIDGAKHNWPLQRGFDKFFGTLIGVGSYWNPITLIEGNEMVKPEADFYYTEEITKKAISFIDNHNQEDPFLLYVAYTAPHFPLHAEPSAIARNKGKFDKGWDLLRLERHARMKELGIIDTIWNLSSRDQMSGSWIDAQDKEWESTRMEAYAGTLSHVDDGIGDIVKWLRHNDAFDNTLIFFLSDNGADYTSHRNGKINSSGKSWSLMRYVPVYTKDGRPVLYGDIPGVELGSENTYGSYGLRWANLSNTPFKKFKTYMHEGGIASPLIVHWPKIIRHKGSIRDKQGHIIDIMATCLDVTNAEYPLTHDGKDINTMDGLSLLPLIQNDEEIHEEGLFWEHQGNRAARIGKWKIVSSQSNNDVWELYDMKLDRTETENLALKKPRVVEFMKNEYKKWTEQTNVLDWNTLSINVIPPVGNPLTRSKEELLVAEEIFSSLLDSLNKMKGESRYLNDIVD